MDEKYISWQQAKNFMNEAFVAIGMPFEDAEVCTEILLESDRRGIDSHGVNRFKPIYIDRINNSYIEWKDISKSFIKRISVHPKKMNLCIGTLLVFLNV